MFKNAFRVQYWYQTVPSPVRMSISLKQYSNKRSCNEGFATSFIDIEKESAHATGFNVTL